MQEDFWASKDYIREIRQSDLDAEKNDSFWTGILIGMTFTTIAIAAALIVLFVH